MRQKKLQNKFLKIKYLGTFFALIIFFLALMYFFYNFFKIKEIKILSKSKEHIAKIAGADLLVDKNLILLDTTKFNSLLVELNPKLTEIKLQKIFPNVLTVSYKLINPIAYLKSNNGYFYLSENAKILEKRKDKNAKLNLTEISYYQKFDYGSNIAGDFLDFTDIRYSLEFLKKLNDLEIEVNSIDINSPNMIRLNLINSTVIFTTEKKINSQLNNLDKIIRKFKVEGKSFSLLDLRFDKPILKLN